MDHTNGWMSGWSGGMWLLVLIGAVIAGSLIFMAMRRQQRK